MQFELNEKQASIVNKVKEFCKKEFNPKTAQELDKKEQFPMDLYRKAAKNGFLSMIYPKEFGGQGCGFLENCLVVEEMCRADSSLGIALSCGTFGSEFILANGSREQKEKYLPKICKGDYISAAAFTEPNLSGSDISMMQTTAIKHGEEWQIKGTKTLITNATLADFIVVLTQTDPDVKPSYKGETLFVVDKDAQGLKTANLKNKLGARCSQTGVVRFTNVKAGSSSIISELNQGFYLSMKFFDKTRLTVAAQALGIAQGAWEIAFEYAKKREAFGQPLLHHELVGYGLADFYAKIDAARMLIYRAAWLVDAGKTDSKATAMAKLYASRVAVETTDFAIQVLAGYGCLGDYRVERYHRDAKITEIYEGTSEIQKLTILKNLAANH